MSKRNVLCLSGGGVKGMLQMAVLKELENRGELKDIDFIIGSSAGAINGAILATGRLTANKLYDIYPAMLKEIFKKKFFPPIYDRQNFINVWNKNVGSILMKDLKTPTIITAIDFCKKETHFFKSWEDTDEDTLNVVLRSFSAPYYFGFLPDTKTQRVYGDGGMADCNLPITETLLESINKDWLQVGDEVKLIIVGTGFTNITESYDAVASKGFIRQSFEFFKLGDGGYARYVSRTEQLGQLQFLSKKFKNLHFDYYDIEIPNKLDSMDALQYITDYQNYGKEASSKALLSF